MEQRFGDPNTKPPAQNYLPHCMRKLLQISCDGAVMHKLQAYVRERFSSDWVPGTDEPHHIETAVVHGMRVREYIKDAPTVLRTVIKAFRKSELMTVLMELESQHTYSLKVHEGRWCEGLCAAIGAVLQNYAAMSPHIKDLLKKKDDAGPAWTLVKQMWFTPKFIEFLGGHHRYHRVYQGGRKKNAEA